MESGEAKLLEPWPHCLQNKNRYFSQRNKNKPKKEHAVHKYFANIKVKVKIAILNIKKIAKDCEANNKMKFKPKTLHTTTPIAKIILISSWKCLMIGKI